MVEFQATALGVRLVVGQQTLDLYAEVRILDPQPEERFIEMVEWLGHPTISI